MAHVVTTTHQKLRTVRRLSLAWISDVSGDVDEAAGEIISGQILRVVTVPDSGGTQPTAAYDLVLNDAHGVDVMAGDGANLSNTDAAQSVQAVPIAIDGLLTVVVGNAGNTKGGTIHIYYR